MLLEVTNLDVRFDTPDGEVWAVRDVSFGVDAGETLGIVGESGSGKSVSTQAVAGLLQGARITGRSTFEGSDLLALPPDKLRAIRGSRIGMIFQDPLTSLHPYYRVGWQIVEQIRAHEQVSRAAARKRAVDLLRLVGIPQPERRVDDYPHQFSGGMRQRAMIAMAMSLNPRLLIADEPTTALDVTVQAQVLAVMEQIQKEFGTAIIMITHDLGVVAEIADRVCVMYAGRIVEQAGLHDAFHANHHPYTQGLLRSIPSAATVGQRLHSIAGQPPSMLDLPSGCSFAPRCEHRMPRCAHERPQLSAVSGASEHRSACWLPVDRAEIRGDVDGHVAPRR
ncbi:MAG TPA: ABC transporter ATP-binding protein [Jatrophihabitans sp.]|jgi:peptide/nickel transport system ATP-binding protein